MWRLKHNDVQAGYISNTANSVESEFNTDAVADNGAVAQSWQSQNQKSTVSRTARSVNNTLDVFWNLLYVSLRMNGMK